MSAHALYQKVLLLVIHGHVSIAAPAWAWRSVVSVC